MRVIRPKPCSVTGPAALDPLASSSSTVAVMSSHIR